MTWAAVLDTETLECVSRLPVFFERKRRDRKSAVSAIRNDWGTTGGGQWLFYGLNEHGDEPRWQLRLPCGKLQGAGPGHHRRRIPEQRLGLTHQALKAIQYESNGV